MVYTFTFTVPDLLYRFLVYKYGLTGSTVGATSGQTLCAGAQTSKVCQILVPVLIFSGSNIQHIERVGPLHPNILWVRFFHSDSFELADQFLTAAANGFPEFGERATAPQSLRSRCPFPCPAGTAFTFHRAKLFFMRPGQDLFVEGLSLSVFALL